MYFPIDIPSSDPDPVARFAAQGFQMQMLSVSQVAPEAVDGPKEAAALRTATEIVDRKSVV